MKKVSFGIFILLFVICSCKKDSKPIIPSTNAEIKVTCTCTFDVKVVQRQNVDLVYSTEADLTGVTTYDRKLNASTKDLFQITVRNASNPPFIVSVTYNDQSLYNESSLTDANANVNVYVP